MPLVEASAMTWSAPPFGTPGAISPGPDTLAGALTAWSGTLVPSGSVPSWPSALAEPVMVRLVVQAPDSSASGTRAVAFWKVVKRLCDDIRSLLPIHPAGRADSRLLPVCSLTHTFNEVAERGLRVGSERPACDLRHSTARRVARLTLGPLGPGSWSGRLAGENARVTAEPAAASSTAQSAALFERAHAVTPGGVNSPVRAFNAVGGTPRFIERATGPYLFDVDGNEYVDLVGSWGPMLLGHAHPQVVEAVRQAVSRGTSYGTPTRPEVELAEAIVGRTPSEKVRFVSSGTEATMSAIRLARGFTGRELVVKFAGCYHGHVDSLLASAGSGLATFAVPGTPGVPESSTALTLVLPYNDRAAVEKAFAEHGHEIA